MQPEEIANKEELANCVGTFEGSWLRQRCRNCRRRELFSNLMDSGRYKPWMPWVAPQRASAPCSNYLPIKPDKPKRVNKPTTIDDL